MYAARDRILPLGPFADVHPFLMSLIMTFLAIFRIVHPVVQRAKAAYVEVTRNDRQVVQQMSQPFH